MGLANSVLLTSPAAPGSETRFQLWWLVRGAEGFSQATELATLPLTVPPWVLSGEGIVKVRVTVNAASAGISVRFNDAVLAVSP